PNSGVGLSTGADQRVKQPAFGTFSLSHESPQTSTTFGRFTQRQQGLMVDEAASNNKCNCLPLHSCLVGLPRFPTGEHPVTRYVLLNIFLFDCPSIIKSYM
ncbi:hypothetical protein, partial [Spirosoma litoris]